MARWIVVAGALAVMTAWGLGCISMPALLGGGNGADVSAVADKAVVVGSRVGGNQGHGGDLMEGYIDHVGSRMGFNSRSDLASPGGFLAVRLHNDADGDGTFHLGYFASHMGLDEQMMDVDVPARGEASVDIPCAEIVGLGPLETPGAPGFHFADGQAVDNMMAVPGFLGLDYVCGGTHDFHLASDVDDLDTDGDTDELICVSDVLLGHMQFGGPAGHSHGSGAA